MIMEIKIDRSLLDSVMEKLRELGCTLSLEEVAVLVDQIKEGVLFHYFNLLISQVESILDINPSLTEKEIFQGVARNAVEYLGAELATVRVYDPAKERMISFGSYPNWEEDRQEAIPLQDSIAGEVVKTRRSYLVPSIAKEEKYDNKEKMIKHGIHSMMAVPISLPRFSLKYVDTEGVLQIYFKEENKAFTPLEAKIAETFSRRVSYVIARKRILALQELNSTKDKIVEQIFLKLGRREGIKLKEVFNLVIPELVDIMRIQRVSLFAVMQDRQHVVLEAGFPEEQHGIGKVFSVKEPYIDTIVNQRGPFGEFENEKIYPTYILIHNPQESRFLPPDLKGFLKSQEIHSVLYIPLVVNEVVNYFLAFDAQSYHRRFTGEQIEVFTFLGMELMKGLRLEKMDDMLHDFKNPAIAVAGFAKRVQRLLQDGNYLSKKEKIDQALEIVLHETLRIQELALTLYEEGRKELLDLTEKLKRRFLINAEAMQELKQENIRMIERDLESPLPIRCSPLMVERVLDNLLNNASKAIPKEGGELSIRSYHMDSWAVAEISNTGQIPEDDKDRCLRGDAKGRGLHITIRLIKQMGGKIEMESQGGQTTFRIMYPLIEDH
jgi:two-component sensor histidine kinase